MDQGLGFLGKLNVDFYLDNLGDLPRVLLEGIGDGL